MMVDGQLDGIAFTDGMDLDGERRKLRGEGLTDYKSERNLCLP